MLWLHGILLLQMIPFGYHLLPQTALIRLLTGQLFAIGLVYYLMVLPRDYSPRWREPVARSVPAYLATCATGVLLLMVLVTWGGPRSRALLSWMGLLGLLLCATMVLLNLVLLALAGRSLVHHTARSSQS
jgi:hypothetical protein